MYLLSLLLIVLPIALSNPSPESNVCKSLPPSLWCTSDVLARKCGHYDECKSYKDNTHNQPVLLTLFYESLCPGCQKFVTEQLPLLTKLFPPQVLKIEIVPYGNAKLYENGTIVCQHGEEECSINKFESCLISALPDQTKHIPVISCLELQLKNGVEFVDATDKCFKTLGVTMDTQTLIQSCLVTHESAQLQEAAALRTTNVFPDQHDHVPWLLFNNASLADAQFLLNDVPSVVCSWYNGDKSVPFCQAEKRIARKFQRERVCAQRRLW